MSTNKATLRRGLKWMWKERRRGEEQPFFNIAKKRKEKKRKIKILKSARIKWYLKILKNK